jgi:hypothetical protein
MSHDDIEPLQPRVWLLQVRKLAARTVAEDYRLEAAFRQALYLSQLTPRPLRHIVRCNLAEESFEELLEAQAFVPAAFALIGDHLGYRLTRAAGGDKVEAQVWLPGEETGYSARGPSIAPTILKAWLGCLATLDELARFTRMSALLPISYKAQAGLRKSTH